MTDATTGIVFDIQRFCTHDGPGIRTVVFLKGCPLHCPWCHNPESRRDEPELRFNAPLCVRCHACMGVCDYAAHVMTEGVHEFYRDKCVSCLACAATCPTGALEVAGREMTVAGVMDEVEKDRVFYEESGGGITLSGGEPMARFEFARSILQHARGTGLHTCMETCGVAPAERWRETIPLVDLFLWDLKHTDERRHRELIGTPLSIVLDNLRQVDAAGGKTRLRCILLAGMNLDDNHLDGVARIASRLEHCQGIDLLPFHPLGHAKHAALGLPEQPNHDWTPDAMAVSQAAEYLRNRCDIPVAIP